VGDGGSIRSPPWRRPATRRPPRCFA